MKNDKRILSVTIKRMVDADRMESLNRGDWCFVGIRAEAKIGVPMKPGLPSYATTYLTNTIMSSGLWGIESDSEEYLTEIEQEQLSELKSQLKALGFSTRAISKAFQNIERSE